MVRDLSWVQLASHFRKNDPLGDCRDGPSTWFEAGIFGIDSRPPPESGEFTETPFGQRIFKGFKVEKKLSQICSEPMARRCIAHGYWFRSRCITPETTWFGSPDWPAAAQAAGSGRCGLLIAPSQHRMASNPHVRNEMKSATEAGSSLLFIKS